MKNVVLKNQMIKIGVSLGLALLITFWQRDFILNSLQANFIVNGIIVSTFLFSIGLLMAFVTGVFDEHKALKSLEEDRLFHHDCKENEGATYKKVLGRCFETPTIINTPRLLNQAYRTVLQELSTHGKVVLTANNLSLMLGRIDENIGRSRQTFAFLGNMLILLGLTGTFIGLMQTVSSIGVVLSTVTAVTDGNIFSQLIQSLRAPLAGMATGFSSSLFGLLGALIVSLNNQFLTEAYVDVRARFEAWINDVAYIVQNATNAEGSSTGAGDGATSKGESASYHDKATTDKQGIAYLDKKAFDRLVALGEASASTAGKIATSVEEFRDSVQSHIELQVDRAKIDMHSADKLAHVIRAMEQLREEVHEVAKGGATIDEVRRLHGLLESYANETVEEKREIGEKMDKITHGLRSGFDLQRSILQNGGSLKATIDKLEGELATIVRENRRQASKLRARSSGLLHKDEGDTPRKTGTK